MDTKCKLCGQPGMAFTHVQPQRRARICLKCYYCVMDPLDAVFQCLLEKGLGRVVAVVPSERVYKAMNLLADLALASRKIVKHSPDADDDSVASWAVRLHEERGYQVGR